MKKQALLSLFLLCLLSMMLILSLKQIPEAHAYSTENFHFYLQDELGVETIDAGIDVTAYFKIGTYTIFHVPVTGYWYNASYDVLYFAFDLGGGRYRQYWLFDGETTGDIWIYAGNNTYGLSGMPYRLQFYDLAGVLSNYSFVEVINKADVDGGSNKGIVERRKVDAEQKIDTWAICEQLYTIKIMNPSNATSYTYGDLLFSYVQTIPLTLKGLDFPQSVILSYRYNRIFSERYNNFSTIKTSYEDTLGDLANVTAIIYFQNETMADSSNYTDTASFIYTWLMAQYNESYIVRVVITHSKYGIMNYNAILSHGGSFNPWNFPLGSLNANVSTADIIPNIIIFACFLLFSKSNAHVGAFLAVAVTIFLCLFGWVSIPATAIMASLVFTIMLGIAYAKRRVWY